MRADVCTHMLIGVCMIYNCSLSQSHRYGPVSVMGRKKGAFGCQERTYFTLSQKLHTHIGAHTSSQTQNQTLSSCQAESFLGLTLIYELWGGRNVAGTLTVDVSATLRSG